MGLVRIPKSALDPTAEKYAAEPNLFVEDCYRVAGEYGVEVKSLLKQMSNAIAILARLNSDKKEQLLNIVRCLCDAGYPPPS